MKWWGACRGAWPQDHHSILLQGDTLLWLSLLLQLWGFNHYEHLKTVCCATKHSEHSEHLNLIVWKVFLCLSPEHHTMYFQEASPWKCVNIDHLYSSWDSSVDLRKATDLQRDPEQQTCQHVTDKCGWFLWTFFRVIMVSGTPKALTKPCWLFGQQTVVSSSVVRCGEGMECSILYSCIQDTPEAAAGE